MERAAASQDAIFIGLSPYRELSSDWWRGATIRRHGDPRRIEFRKADYRRKETFALLACRLVHTREGAQKLAEFLAGSRAPLTHSEIYDAADTIGGGIRGTPESFVAVCRYAQLADSILNRRP